MSAARNRSGRPHRAECKWYSQSAVGADRRDRRHRCDDTRPATNLRAGHNALSLDGQHRRRQRGQCGVGLQHLEWHESAPAGSLGKAALEHCASAANFAHRCYRRECNRRRAWAAAGIKTFAVEAARASYPRVGLLPHLSQVLANRGSCYFELRGPRPPAGTFLLSKRWLSLGRPCAVSFEPLR